jgi:hypothetical protein
LTKGAAPNEGEPILAGWWSRIQGAAGGVLAGGIVSSEVLDKFANAQHNEEDRPIGQQRFEDSENVDMSQILDQKK